MILLLLILFNQEYQGEIISIDNTLLIQLNTGVFIRYTSITPIIDHEGNEVKLQVGDEIYVQYINDVFYPEYIMRVSTLDERFNDSVESWIADNVMFNLTIEDEVLIRNLGSKSWLARKRATQELRKNLKINRKLLLWGREVYSDPEIQHRIEYLLREVK